MINPPTSAVTAGERWQHVKRGTAYDVIGRASLQNATGKQLSEADAIVIYRDLEGCLWAREEGEFTDGRFARLSAPALPVEGGWTDESTRLSAVIDRDRYVVAIGLEAIRKAIGGHTWLLEGRGPYAWDDDDYRREFSTAIAAVEAALVPLARIAADKSDCTTDSIKVQEARDAARQYLAASPSVEAGPDKRTTLVDLLEVELADTYDCTRVWSAWSVGTMDEDDFRPASERAADIADAILEALK